MIVSSPLYGYKAMKKMGQIITALMLDFIALSHRFVRRYKLQRGNDGYTDNY